ncbi:P-loop containing nucleoside triphosphate hydrolase protein, partial [Blyttiomyces helicus]
MNRLRILLLSTRRRRNPNPIPLTQTGKTPVSLLHEHCAKLGWNKPQYNSGRAPAGFQCRITISRKDLKTRSTRQITMFQAGKVYATDQESKHYAATYVLHRVGSHLSTNLLLPPIFKTFWRELDAVKAETDRSKAQFEYHPDPFLAEDQLSKTAKVQLAEKAVAEARENDATFPVVHMTAEHRAMVEELLRGRPEELSASGIGANGDEIGGGGQSREEVMESVVGMGFRRAHVEEALSFCRDQAAVIHWLCIHVPEDDLPPNFLNPVNPEIVGKRHTTESLAREYVVDRLTAAGFSRGIAVSALARHDGNELAALTHLCRHLIPDDPASSEEEDPSPDDLALTRTEELEALEAIYGDALTLDPKSGSDATRLFIRVDLPAIDGETTLELGYLHSSRYPHEPPALVVRNPTLPAYIRLHVMRSMQEEARSLLGAAMAFSLVSWLEDRMPGFVDSPPPLVGISAGLFEKGAEVAAVERVERGKGGGRAPRAPRDPKKMFDLSRKLREEFARQKDSPAYRKMEASREMLPAASYKEKIVQALAMHQTVIICGETGCGKSTQVGQFILDAMLLSNQGASCNIICTQPRRISATSLAERVAAERTEKVGKGMVGYAIRGETVRGKDTRLVFCTTGILLRMIQSDPDLHEVSHIVVDEVHERGVDSDFLLVLVRSILTRRPTLRLILMSATVNSETFSAYFGGAPVLEIPGRTNPVRDYYVEDLLKFVSFDSSGIPRMKRIKKGEEDSEAARERAQYEEDGLDERDIDAIAAVEKVEGGINFGLIGSIVRHICLEAGEEGAILIFLPGVNDISRCIDTLRNTVGRECGKLSIMPLHANLSSKEQSAVFRKMAPGERKIVVATNVAETSITIDDVVFVIDSGKEKVMQFNGSMLALVETWASKASCRQRRGRAGRVRPGKCFKLFSRSLEKKKMSDHALPEIARMPLEQLCLSVLALGWTDVRGFLGQAIDPPPLENIESAMRVLTEVGAVERGNEKMTALGQHLAMIPADLRIGKILLFGAIFKCLSPVLTIAACMSNKSPFFSPMEKRDESR